MRRSCVCVVSLVAALTFWTSPVSSQPGIFPPGEFRNLVRDKCTTCHVATQVIAQRRTAAQWSQVIESMILQGAVISDEEFSQITLYLSTNFGPVGVVDLKNGTIEVEESK